MATEWRVTIPTFAECDDRAKDNSDRARYMRAMYGGKLDPLEDMVVHRYVDSTSEFESILKNLVEWCLNHPNQVLYHHQER